MNKENTPLQDRLSKVYDDMRPLNEACFGKMIDKKVEWNNLKLYIENALLEDFENDYIAVNILKSMLLCSKGLNDARCPIYDTYKVLRSKYDEVRNRLNLK